MVRRVVQVAVWTLFLFVVLSFVNSLERRLAAAAGTKHSEEFGKQLQAADLWWQEEKKRDPEGALRAAIEIKAARYSVRIVAAIILAGMVVWFSSGKETTARST